MRHQPTLRQDAMTAIIKVHHQTWNPLGARSQLFCEICDSDHYRLSLTSTYLPQLLKEVCDMGEDEKISVQSMSLLETERQGEFSLRSVEQGDYLLFVDVSLVTGTLITIS